MVKKLHPLNFIHPVPFVLITYFIKHTEQNHSVQKVNARFNKYLQVCGVNYSAVVGSIIVETLATELAGNPPCFACSLTISSLGAL